MRFHYECKARGLDGNVDGNLRRCEIVSGITRNALDGKADGNFNYKTYYLSTYSLFVAEVGIVNFSFSWTGQLVRWGK